LTKLRKLKALDAVFEVMVMTIQLQVQSAVAQR
jgi:hypothetical protein